MKLSIPGCIALLVLSAFQAGAADPPPKDTPPAAHETVEQLPEIVVSASRVPLEARKVGSAVTVITAEEIERKQVRAVSDVLREVPGIAISRAGGVGTFTQARIRGAEGNHTLVILDGVEVNDPSADSEFHFDDLLAADVERIEVLRGPQSALYGSDAIGGVINIMTKRGRGPVTGSFDLEGGSFGTGSVSAGIRGGGDRRHFSFGGTGLTTSGVSIAPESEGNTEKDGYRNRTGNARLGMELLEGLDVEMFGRHVNSRVETDPSDYVEGISRPVDGDAETKTTHWTGRTQLKYRLFDGAWEHKVGAAINQKKREHFTNGSPDRYDGRKSRFDYQTSFFFETSALAEATHSVTFLTEREKDSQRIRAFVHTDNHVTSRGYTGSYQVGLQERLFLSGSLRHDNNNHFKDATTFRVTAAFLLDGSGTRLHGSYGTGIKNPTLFELFGYSPDFVPNPDLKPEQSTGWDMGVEQSLAGDGLSLDVTYFNNRITELIQGISGTPVNLDGTTRIHGLELMVNARMTEDLTFTGQYTYTDSKDANGVELTRRAKHLASANLAYDFLDGRADLDLGIDYNGRQNDSQFLSVPPWATRVTLDDFVLVHVTASYAVMDNVEIFGRIENLLDDDYEEVFGFGNTGIGGFLGIRGRLELF